MIDYSETGISTEKVSDDYLLLNSCGIEYLHDRDRGSMRKNGRSDYHILYIERGACRLRLGENEVRVGEGGLILFRPGEPQIYSFLAIDDSISHYIHFTGSGIPELFERLGIGEIRFFEMGESSRYKQISAEMVREFTMKQPFYETICAAKLMELFALIAKKYSLRHNRVSHIGESRIDAACRRIYENLASPPSAAELAADSCLSVSRFTHLFREVTGRSLHDFIISMRIDRAKELLSTGELSVKETAQVVGFEDQNYFSRLFKSRTGLPPREYR